MQKSILYLFTILLAFSCKNAIVYNDPIPEHDTYTIPSKIVNEDRVVNVWTPPIYEESTDSLPVLYMADGGIKEDFPHIANTLADLIAENKIPPFILVGIENTERGRDLFGPTKVAYDLKHVPKAGGSANFRKFIKDELFPLINEKYKTTNKKALIGESASGLFVVETFFLDNDMFDYYIAMDPSLWFNEQYLVNNFDKLTSGKDYSSKKLWFAGSTASDISPFTKQLEKKFKNADTKLKWKYSDEPEEKHNTIFRATKEKALIWALNNNEP